jgi:uncharacterized protein involved in exopolysaccharide biosynthesis
MSYFPPIGDRREAPPEYDVDPNDAPDADDNAEPEYFSVSDLLAELDRWRIMALAAIAVGCILGAVCADLAIRLAASP